MAARAGSRRLAAAAVAAVVAGALGTGSVTPVGAAGGDQPEPGRWYRSGRRANPSVRMFAAGEGPGERRVVVLGATFQCDELELDGVVLATVERDGTFATTSGSFALTGGGTDEVDAQVEVIGRFGGRGAGGTISAAAEAFDNAGTTGTCDEELDWTARARGTDASLARIEATVELRPGPAAVAAAPDAAYVATDPDDAVEARVHRIDAATGEVAWEAEPGIEVAALSATTAGVWAVDVTESQVVRLDPATGEAVTAVPLPGSAPATSIAASDTAVWVGAGDLYRIDPSTNTVVATVDLGADVEDAVVALGADAVFVAVNLPRPEDAGGLAHRLLRVDPAANAIAADVDGTGHFETLTSSGDVLWAAPSLEPVRVFDAAALDEIGAVDAVAHAAAATRPGVWLLTDRGVAAYDAASETAAAHIPLLGRDFGSVAAAADTVWVWDSVLGTLTRVAAG
ncbi:MAG TPA: hypothetical protein VF152_14515 [Acidimicrobiia bacterium]